MNNENEKSIIKFALPAGTVTFSIVSVNSGSSVITTREKMRIDSSLIGRDM